MVVRARLIVPADPSGEIGWFEGSDSNAFLIQSAYSGTKGMRVDNQLALVTCTRDDCEGCPVGGMVTCHFTNRDRAIFTASAIPAFLIAFVGLFHLHWYLAIIMVALTVAYFGFIEVWSMCSHCPHYAEPGTASLRCWANYGCPKIRRYQPGPMSRGEKVVFLGGMTTVMGFPALVFVLGGTVLFFLVYVASIVFLFGMLTTHFCSRCMNLACPINRVDDATRRAFQELNPSTVDRENGTFSTP